jgi:hypothetical protein
MELPVALPLANGMRVSSVTLEQDIYAGPETPPIPAPCMVFFFNQIGDYQFTYLYNKAPNGDMKVHEIHIPLSGLGAN